MTIKTEDTIELKTIHDKILKLFNIEKVEELKEKLFEVTMDKNNPKIFKEYLKIIKGHEDTDWIQAIYEHYLSDREEKSQDYTPICLSKLCSSLTRRVGSETVYDMCSGSGSLTLQKYEQNHNANFILHELDPNVLPFCLFNLCLKNIDAVVVLGDTLKCENKEAYRINPTKKYGYVTRDNSFLQYKFDTVISNPPFNLKVEDEYKVDGLVIPSKTANYHFIMKALSYLKPTGQSAFILPAGVLTSSQEAQARKYLLERGYLKAVITCPDKMFENTNIPVVIFVLTKDSVNEVVLINAREKCDTLIRDMCGELHMKNRVYHKAMNVFSDDHIEWIADNVVNPIAELGLVTSVPCKKILEESKDYALAPSRYVGFKPESDHSRSFKEIVTDINKLRVEKNKVKLTVNLSTITSNPNIPYAQKKAFQELLDNISQAEEFNDVMNKSFEGLRKVNSDFDCPDLVDEKYVTISKTKNMFKLENTTKDEPLESLRDAFVSWQTLIKYLNNREVEYLIELRDKMLPLLMSGELDVNCIELPENEA